MKHHLLALTGLSLLITACQAIPLPGRPPATVSASRTGNVSAVHRITYGSRENLDRLVTLGLDLFEDARDGEVGARLTTAQVTRLERAGYGVSRAMGTLDMPGQGKPFPAGYHRVDEVEAEFRAMAARSPQLARFHVLGRSLEGRPIFALQFGTRSYATRPEVLFYSGVHARELPPVEVMWRLAHHLEDGYGRDPVVTELLQQREIWIVPLVNPDGRVRVQAGADMWRKNARNNGDGTEGVDLNRNYDARWEGGNPHSIDEDYHGPRMESEPETLVMRNFMAAHAFKLSVDMHCFAGAVLWPPGYDNHFTKDEVLLGTLGRAIANRLAYRAGTIERTLYRVCGDSSTWANEKLGTLAFTVELDDRGFSPAFEAVDRDWEQWRWPLVWLARMAANPAAAPSLLPNEPKARAGFSGFPAL